MKQFVATFEGYNYYLVDRNWSCAGCPFYDASGNHCDSRSEENKAIANFLETKLEELLVDGCRIDVRWHREPTPEKIEQDIQALNAAMDNAPVRKKNKSVF